MRVLLLFPPGAEKEGLTFYSDLLTSRPVYHQCNSLILNENPPKGRVSGGVHIRITRQYLEGPFEPLALLRCCSENTNKSSPFFRSSVF